MTKIGAIWARVSTPEQMSLESQIARAEAKLEDQGYVVPPERILAADWTSLDLFSCPEFQKLRTWIQRKEIQALGILDRDRLEADGLQRLVFLADCRDAGVELVICQGSPILDEEEGQLVELALTIGKKRSVLRARQGSKDGLHDRAVIRRLPTSHHKIFGYKWEGKTPEELKLSRRLLPAMDSEDWDTVKLILDMTLDGATEGDIRRELKARGILSPNGLPEWTKGSISNIQRSHIYGGRYYALTKRVVEPTKRRGNTYGNSSSRLVPLEEAVYLPEIEIVNPPITWQQHLQILARLEKNQKLAKRNAEADYLLRGFIFCETHYGKKGEPRIYYGKPDHDTWIYKCPVCGCAHPNLNGQKLEETVKGEVRWLLTQQPEEFYDRFANKHNTNELRQSLDRELSGLETKYNRNINAETDLERRDLQGQEHPEVYRRIKSSLQAERVWIGDRKEAIEQQLSQLDRQVEVVAGLREIQAKVKGRLGKLSKAEWRELFITLNLEIHCNRRWSDNEGKPLHEGRIEPCIGTPELDFDYESAKEIVLHTPLSPQGESEIEVCFGLPVKVERVGEIVYNRLSSSVSALKNRKKS